MYLVVRIFDGRFWHLACYDGAIGKGGISVLVMRHALLVLVCKLFIIPEPNSPLQR